MRRAQLDGRRIHSREELHDALAGAVSLPDWYGRNLDALLDSLSELEEETCLRVTGAPALAEALGPYGEALLRVLRRAEEENANFRLELEP